MESNNPAALLAMLRRPDLRVRVGLWLQPLSTIGAEADEAARLMVQPVDLRAELLAALPTGARYAHINEGGLLTLLDSLSQRNYAGGCALVYNLDLLLAALTQQEQGSAWEFLFTAMVRRKSALLLTLPITATRLMPNEPARQQWLAAQRLTSVSAL